MYQAHFNLKQEPFSIAPDPSFLYLSRSHNEALAHLMYGFSHGGFVMITGEVGTGKTTLLRNLIHRTPPELDVAFILNPRLTVRELLESVCDELGVAYEKSRVETVKSYIDVLNRHLLATHRAGRSTVLIIDEAQNLSPAVLEQIRLLTNLETDEKKLLRIILLGQPELGAMLDRREMRQLAQRITARFHLGALNADECKAYVAHRLKHAGGSPHLFNSGAQRALYRASGGIPRLINVIADRALLGAYVQGAEQVDARTVRHATQEVLGTTTRRLPAWLMSAVAGVAGITAILWLVLNVFDIGTLRAGGNKLPLTEVPVEETADTPPAETASTPAIQSAAESVPPLTQPESTAGTPPAPADVSRPEMTPFAMQREAYRHVFGAWNISYSPETGRSPCEHAEQNGLRCLQARGAWSELRQLNLPVVLELWDNLPDPYYAALTALNEDTVELHLGNASLTANTMDLRNAWFGAYTVLWRQPEGYVPNLKLGDTHSSIQWLRARLQQIYGASLNNASADYFDKTLDASVRTFQRDERILVDGIVGPMTWLRLSARTDEGPSLRHNTTETQQPPER